MQEHLLWKLWKERRNVISQEASGSIDIAPKGRSHWSLSRYSLLLLFLGSVVASYHQAEIDFALLLSQESQRNIWRFAQGLFPPDLSFRFLSLMFRPTVETIQISLMGTLIAMLIGFPLSLMAASTLTFSGKLHEMSRGKVKMGVLPYLLARFLLNFFRSIPDLLWALMFVRAVGLGPFAGVLAIGISYGGMVGKIYAEIFEALPQGSLEALHAAGASKGKIIWYGLLPQALPSMISYSLYRWECAIRSAAILGLVGAGGLGQQIEISMRMFNYRETATILLLTLLLVTIVDSFSSTIRKLL
ncbi:MAG: phosphonate ABC transporter, permease protein PhnE [Candidatus Tectomicrobia bacterium]|nr:phosphonate ABC transporter, permease protein PhnE [Candidatus Tectomicrobia bacterium]